MKTPNEKYKQALSKRNGLSRVISFIAAARHPRRALRLMFGFNKDAQNIADDLNMGPCRQAFDMVVATLKTWKKDYRGPKLSWMFFLLSTPPTKRIPDTRKPELD